MTGISTLVNCPLVSDPPEVFAVAEGLTALRAAVPLQSVWALP